MKNKFLSIFMTIFFLMAMVSPALAAREHQGKPSRHESENSMGYFIWQDGSRWHLRTVNGGTQHSFTGKIETDGAFTDVSTVQSEKVDRVAVSVRDQTIDFHLNSASKTDGFSFAVNSGQRLTFTLYVDGTPVDPSNVNLGRGNRNPKRSPFTVRLVDDESNQSGVPMTSYEVQGQPTAMVPGNILGYFLWQEGDRWYLKTTTRGAERQFTGIIRTNGRFTDINRNNLESNDRNVTNNASNEIKFDLKSTGGTDGLSFRMTNSTDVTFTLYLDGKLIDPSNVYIGNANRHPGTNAFTVNLNPNSTYKNSGSSRYLGQPAALNPGNAFGYFIWQDQNRWYLQTTTYGEERNFKGVIETEGTFSEVQKMRSLRTDNTRVDTAGNKIRFEFKTGGSGNGISFSFPEGLKMNQIDKVSGLSFLAPDGGRLKFTLYVDGVAINPSNIYLGSSNWHPSSNVILINPRN